MKLAILFWFYKEPQICKNHLELIRRYNATISIYGLYGGELEDADKYKLILGEYLDDFYIFSQNKSSSWKWHLGDLLITDWYSQRGKDLWWDTIVIIQWDMLVFGSIYELFSMLQKDSILLSGLIPIKEIENRWIWTSTRIVPEIREQYLEFLNYVKEKYSYNQEPFACLFIVVCFPRSFLEKYSRIEQPELGFLEYRVPIYAQIFGTPFCVARAFQISWFDDSTTSKNRETLNAKRCDISLITILKHLIDSKGARVFHPYRKIFPLNMSQLLWIFPIFFQEWMDGFVNIIKQIRYQKQ
ncbi:hypothetical protein IQ238_07575 [Pleurocapsales cyanobacterium LEGE 06147]|nr:hypothetical protein [Pleurocapsales cyanobacterium LEGE 06147]